MLTCSTYEAKAKLSELLRRAEAGETIVITRHGKKVARLGPPNRRAETFEERFERLKQEGVISPAEDPDWFGKYQASGDPVPGGLQRFLDERE